MKNGLKFKIRNSFTPTIVLFFILLIFGADTSFGEHQLKCECLIKGSLVFDGTQNKPVKTDIGITGNKITYIGNADAGKVKAAHIIHAEGLYVSPGFIDPHTHNDRWLNSTDKLTRRNLPSLAQGVTTVFIGNDGAGRHPRAYGAFARKIREYGLEEKKMSLETVIYSSTGHTATLLGLKERGFIRENYVADIVIFEPAKIKDEVTFEQPELLATGVNYVFVNGVLSVKDGHPAEVWAGRALRHASAVEE